MPSYQYAEPRFSWNEEAVSDLLQLSTKGKSASEIAAFLSHKFKTSLTRNAVIGKRLRMGLCKPMDEIRAIQERTRKLIIPKPAKPPKPPKNEAASIDRVRRLQEVEIMEEVNPDTISLHPRTIMDPLFGGCRWPVGATEDGEMLSCCNDRGDLRPYCSSHRRLAFQASRSPSQIAHDAKLRAASQRAHSEKTLFARVNVL